MSSLALPAHAAARHAHLASTAMHAVFDETAPYELPAHRPISKNAITPHPASAIVPQAEEAPAQARPEKALMQAKQSVPERPPLASTAMHAILDETYPYQRRTDRPMSKMPLEASPASAIIPLAEESPRQARPENSLMQAKQSVPARPAEGNEEVRFLGSAKKRVPDGSLTPHYLHTTHPEPGSQADDLSSVQLAQKLFDRKSSFQSRPVDQLAFGPTDHPGSLEASP